MKCAFVFCVFWCSTLNVMCFLHLNNMCHSDEAYDNIHNSKDCYFNPDFVLTLSEIVKRNGYAIEKHSVTTKDGYILSLYRIPHNNRNIDKPRQPIFLLHGIAQRSITWVDGGNLSLAYYLSENNYDVWLGTTRGESFSQAHVHFGSHPKNENYWNFSLHHIAIYDLSAQIEFIANYVNTDKKIIYIGHSMGATLAYIYTSIKSTEAENYLSGIILLAPVVYAENSPTFNTLTRVGPTLEKLLNALGIHGIATSTLYSRLIQKYMISTGSNGIKLLRLGLKTIFNEDTIYSCEKLAVYFNSVPDGVSVQVLKNFWQFLLRKAPVAYDYGKKRNLELYGISAPLLYNSTDIHLPVHIFYGVDDSMADEKDVLHLYDELQTTKSLTRLTGGKKNYFAHLSFICPDANIEETFYLPLLQKIKSLP